MVDISKSSEALQRAVDSFVLSTPPYNNMEQRAIPFAGRSLEISTDLLRVVAAEISRIHPDSRDFDDEIERCIENLHFDINRHMDDLNCCYLAKETDGERRSDEMRGK